MAFTLENLKSLVGVNTENSPSPYARWLLGTIIMVEYGTISLEFIARPEMTNPVGNVHGGVIAGILDEVIGICLITLDLPTFFTTINLNIDYLTPILVGEKMLCNAQVIRKGKKIIHVDSFLYKPNQILAAKASSNLIDSGISVY